MKTFAGALLAIVMLSSFYQVQTLEGKWEYVGDIFNGKKEGPPKEYSLQRTYSQAHFEANVIQKGSMPEMYETGDYWLKDDSCLEVQTFSNQDSKLLNIPIHYHYTVTNDTLTLKGILPNGERVEEYWKRMK